MRCFVLNRRKIQALGLAWAISGIFQVQQPLMSYAESSWVDLLKPLVKDVIVPGASMGMKKIIEKKQKKETPVVEVESAVEAENTVESATDSSAMESVEEPVSQQNWEDPSIPTPDGMDEFEQYTATSDAGNAAISSPSEPPPPVATP